MNKYFLKPRQALNKAFLRVWPLDGANLYIYKCGFKHYLEKKISNQ